MQEKLETERETFHKLHETTKIYNTILKSATDNMGTSVKMINDQFEHERLLAEEAKAKEEADAKMDVAEEAVVATAATAATGAKEQPEITEEKNWQVVDQV